MTGNATLLKLLAFLMPVADYFAKKRKDNSTRSKSRLTRHSTPRRFASLELAARGVQPFNSNVNVGKRMNLNGGANIRYGLLIAL